MIPPRETEILRMVLMDWEDFFDRGMPEYANGLLAAGLDRARAVAERGEPYGPELVRRWSDEASRRMVPSEVAPNGA